VLNARLAALSSVDIVLDVGANTGQYASRLRAQGYRGQIVSFEPLVDAYAQLEAAASEDPLWLTFNVALGDMNAQAVIHVSENSYPSSLLPLTERCRSASPDVAYVSDQAITMAKLDDLVVPEGLALLKIDVQGTEDAVIRGAHETLRRVVAVEIELSLVSLYRGQKLAHEMCAMLRTKGFVPVALENAFADPATNEVLQIDCLFRRS
jgi:FkbM family methyltransferase